MTFNKILIIRLSSIGDIILATPLLRAVKKKYPSANIHFAVKQEYADLLRFNPYVDKLIPIDFKNAADTLQQTGAENYDWVINIQKSSRSRQLIAHTSKALVTGYSKQRFTRFLLIAFKWNFYKRVKPVYERYFEAVHEQGVTYDDEGTEVFFSREDEIRPNDMLRSFTTGELQNLVTICPGASFTNKMWTEDGFVALAKKMQQTYHAGIALLGGPSDRERCEQIKTRLEGAVINFAGQLKLLESAALLKKSRIVISNDSGMLHLAQSQKVPVAGVFGPTVKEFGFFPLPGNSVVIEKAIGCRPCTKMGKNYCPKGHHQCMKAITATMVYEAVGKLLAEKQS